MFDKYGKIKMVEERVIFFFDLIKLDEIILLTENNISDRIRLVKIIAKHEKPFTA